MTPAKTIRGLIEAIALDLSEEPEETRIDVSPEDVGRIVSLFLARLANSSPRHTAIDNWLNSMAGECMQVRNEE